jgi:PIN domain nuclease of toxin-antitoxin system
VSCLLDTHVLLWWRGDPSRLSRQARRRIEAEDRALVSPVSLWEVATLLRLRRIELDRDLFTWIQDLLSQDVELAELSAWAAAEAGTWDASEFPGDPADRLIYATAKDLHIPLVSKDARLSEVATARRDIEVVW